MRAEGQEHLRRAAELLHAAELMLAHGLPADSVSRSYYAMFHAATAALLSVGVERSSHGAVIAAFSQFLVKPGLIEKRHHTLLRKAFEARSESDYWPSPAGSLQKAQAMLDGARELVDACRRLVEKEEG